MIAGERDLSLAEPVPFRTRLILAEDLKAKLGIENCPVIRSTACVARAFEEIALLNREVMIVGAIDSCSRLLNWSIVSVGASDRVMIRIGELFHGVISVLGSGIILVHNHPSGCNKPSNADVRLTQDVAEAGIMLGYPLVDHVIISRNGSCSVMTPSLLLRGKKAVGRGIRAANQRIAAASQSQILRWRCNNCSEINLYCSEYMTNGLCYLNRCSHCHKLGWIIFP